MKKKLLAGLIAGLAVSSLASAQGYNAGAYKKDSSVNVSIGQADIIELKDTAVAVSIGYEQEVSVIPGISVGVDGAFSTTQAKESTPEIKADFWSISAYTKYSYRLSENWHVGGKVGYAYIDYAIDSSGVSLSADDNEMIFGAGFAYDLDDYTSLTGDYAVYQDIDLLTVGIKYRF